MVVIRWFLILGLLSAMLGLLIIAIRPSLVASTTPDARLRPLPPGDQEIAWIHTTTNGSAWERFVTGLKRVEMHVPGVHIDDTEAFLDETTAVPELVIRKDGYSGALRVRWYKITGTGHLTTEHWIRRLAERVPAPLALIGGGSSDRALELASRLEQHQHWQGDRPALLVTTATAVEVYPDHSPGDLDAIVQPQQLIDIYRHRTFRFCFNNRQIAEAVTKFVFVEPSLRPGPIIPVNVRLPLLMASGPWNTLASLAEMSVDLPPSVFSVAWTDDPYSVDLSWQFKSAISQRFAHRGDDPWLNPRFHQFEIPFSVGSFFTPNRYEAQSAEAMVSELPAASERSLLLLPTTPPAARRFLRTLCESTPFAENRLVAVTGDGISLNVIYRDGEISWPVRALPVPLVMFTHYHPFAWDDNESAPVKPPTGYELRPPNSTEDVLLFAELGRQVIDAAFGPEARLVSQADLFSSRLRSRSPAFFDEKGDRLAGTGEFIVVLRPNKSHQSALTEPSMPDATVEVYRPGADQRWQRVQTLPLLQTRRHVRGMP